MITTQYCFFVLLHGTICHHIIVLTHHHIMMLMYAHIIVSLSYHNTLLYTHTHTQQALTLCFRAKMDPRQAFISQHLSKDDMRYEKTGVCVSVCVCVCLCVSVCPHARTRDMHNNSQKQAHFPAATSRISSIDPPPLTQNNSRAFSPHKNSKYLSLIPHSNQPPPPPPSYPPPPPALTLSPCT